MKILWIVNTVFPEPSKVLGLPVPIFGGWMYGLADELSKRQGIELAVATIFSGNDLKEMKLKGINYFMLPSKGIIKYDTDLEDQWKYVCDLFQPDVVHIHGTEYAHGLACMRKLPQLNYVVSIQGLVSAITRYYYAGIPAIDIAKNITFRDILRMDTIFQAKKKFETRGFLEREYIERTKHILGRTKWDFAHTKAINSKVQYHFCNESLRVGFYSAKKWSFNSCNRFTLFLSQAGYPIKGLHQVIKAVSILKVEYPNLKIRVGGANITKRETIIERVKRSGYGKYVTALLKKHKLEKNIVFLGLLSEEQIIAEYQKSHIFICPSSIENSPNSLGEAQLLGVPTIAAYVGGVPDMIENGNTGLLYRFEEIEMLADNIRRIFNSDMLALHLSSTATIEANTRHDREVNFITLLNIYGAIQ